MHSVSSYLPRRSRLPTNCARSIRPLSWGATLHQNDSGGPSGSAKLFADAEREEANERANESHPSSRLSFLENQHANWDGEERMEDAVLRMLVDKYKPLRGGTIRTAEEKLKKAPPPVHLDIVKSNLTSVPTSNWQSIANEPLLPAVEGHRPWLTTYKVPSHVTTSIRAGRMPPSVSARTSGTSQPLDDRARRKAKDLKKRKEEVGRLTRAKESTLDYRLGAHKEPKKQVRPNPVSMRGWTSLIEDKIERAREAGIFNKVSGRGKPLVRHMDEGNPFIGREEFLMNRIVQRNGAAPPWVEAQGELETAVAAFREILRQSWIRCALRSILTSEPLSLLHRFTLADVAALRDHEWEARERLYHDTAVNDLNRLVRNYNGVAPAAVRRAYYLREVELSKTYEDAAHDILLGIKERLSQGHEPRLKDMARESTNSRGVEMDLGPPVRIRDVIRQWLSNLTSGGRRS